MTGETVSKEPVPGSNQPNLAGVALVIFSGCCFGTLAIFGKMAYRLGLSTPQLLAYRFACAAVLFWGIAAIAGQRPPTRRSLAGLVIMGAVGYAGQSAAYFSALHFIAASSTALLLYTYPVVVTLAAAALFGESITWSKVMAVGLAFVGTLLVVQAQFKGAAPIGILLGLTSAAVYSGYILFGSRLLPGIPPVSATATIMSAAALVWITITTGSGQLLVSWTPSRLALIGGFVVGNGPPGAGVHHGVALDRRLPRRHSQHDRAGQHRDPRGPDPW